MPDEWPELPPHPETKFDEAAFVKGLRGSISLMLDEKYRVLAALPRLSQFQIDELMKILSEEREKFSRLSPKHLLQLRQLEHQFAVPWCQLLVQMTESKAAAEWLQRRPDAQRQELLAAVAAAAANDVLTDQQRCRVYTQAGMTLGQLGHPEDALQAYTRALALNTVASGKTELANGTLSFVDGTAKVTSKSDHPGVLVLKVNQKTPWRNNFRCGAAVGWQAIRSTVPEPADFDGFWKKKLEELAEVPMSPVLEEVPDSGSPDVQLWKVTMDGIRGTRIYGYLARPKGTGPLPANCRCSTGASIR